MQKRVLIALAVVGTLTAGYFLLKNTKKAETNTTALKDVYNQWKVNYKINVGAAEDDYRFKVFSTNYGKINQHNRLLGRSYNLGLNSFSHLTQSEFAATHLGYKALKTAAPRKLSTLATTNLTAKSDWTSKMNAVKDQASCGSCWAFSAVGALEGLHSVKNSNLLNLSEQELVDCSSSYGNEGCNGGLMDQAFQYVIEKKGLASQKDYPYTAVDGKCKTIATRYAPISGFVDVKVNSSAALKAALAQQPVSVAVQADSFDFQGYKSGVLSGKACGTELDHGVVAVGYNDEDRTPYYVVRNSWGSNWGDKGHIKIAIEDGPGVCGIQMAASYPTL